MTAETWAVDPLRNRLHLHTFKKSRHFHTNILEHIDSVHLSDGISFEICEFVCACMFVCVSVCVAGLNFQWLMEMFSHLRYYICFSGTTPLLPSDLHPDDIPVWPASSQPCDEWDGLIYIILLELELQEWKETHKSSRTLDTHLKHVRHVWLLFEETATHLLKCAWKLFLRRKRISCSKLVQ